MVQFDIECGAAAVIAVVFQRAASRETGLLQCVVGARELPARDSPQQKPLRQQGARQHDDGVIGELLFLLLLLFQLQFHLWTDSRYRGRQTNSPLTLTRSHAPSHYVRIGHTHAFAQVDEGGRATGKKLRNTPSTFTTSTTTPYHTHQRTPKGRHIETIQAKSTTTIKQDHNIHEEAIASPLHTLSL